MNHFLKKNINLLLGVFILIQPVLDLLTGLCLHLLNINLTIGIIIRVLFLLLICYVTLFVFKKKKLLIPYSIIIIYCLLYIAGIIIYKDGGLFKEIQELVKTFYFPILLISFYSIRDEIRISKMTLFVTLFLYLIFIFIPLILGLGYQSYKITKAGTLGFYNSANEISGIISILTPIMLIIMTSSKKIIPRLILILMYLTVILMIGTKTPLLALIITCGFSLIYLWSKSIKERQFKNLFISILIVLICMSSLIIIIPKTNFYKNIETHLDFLELDNIGEVFEDEELIDHFIFSQRLTFFAKKARLYKKASTYQKLFGIGYLRNNKPTKMIEMDYFDIYYSHGLVGFLLFFSIFIYVLYKVLRKNDKMTYSRYMTFISLILIIFLAFFTGHIITAPSVSLIVIVIILSIEKREKLDVLLINKSIDKINKKQLENIDYTKYNITLVIAEESKNKINKNIIIKKQPNKLLFKIFNYHNYDFSCCFDISNYNDMAQIASNNIIDLKELRKQKEE
ncbi:MAG: O-antigen ligase family protein [Bacilli bacterium]|nr:O-antigen ligase family protein [Bacilli bacterium]